MWVSFKELRDAFEFVDFEGGYGGNSAYICKESGKIYWRSEQLDDDEQDLPDDVEDEEKYLAVPDRKELELGKRLVLDFAHQFLANDVSEVHRIFSKRGAYANFKRLLTRRGALERWYEFEDKAEELALREWCSENSIELID